MMPLRDHFHKTNDDSEWPGMHSGWMQYLLGRLNRHILPTQRYRAKTHISIRGEMEIDVATLKIQNQSGISSHDPGHSVNGNTLVATLPQMQTWVCPIADAVIPSVFPTELEIRIVDLEKGSQLVGAIEIVSPANKDRPEHRQAFVSKCASLLYAGVGLVVVDVITNRRTNLHDKLMDWMERPEAKFPQSTPLYATSYRCSRVNRDDPRDQIEIWRRELKIGEALPIMPLPLKNGPIFPLELEPAYAETCADNLL